MEKFGKYEIIEEIGRGAMGIVYKALDPDINREVAIKTIRFDMLSDGSEKEEMMRRFIREAQAVGKLEHSNIITIYNVGREGDSTYIVMQYIEGKSLQEILSSGKKYASVEIVKLITCLCSALGYAHKRGVVHRDIKPANILIDNDGNPFLVDFGVALIEMSTMTLSGTIAGTPSYMAPEQVMGKKVTSQADIFSLGVILYELLTGKRPFAGEHITTVVYKIINEKPSPLSKANRDIPEIFERVVTKALAKDPVNRYKNCLDMAVDLQQETQLFDKTITMDLGKGFPGGISKKRRWKEWALYLVLFLIVIIAGGYFLFPEFREMIFPKDKAITELGVTPVPRSPVIDFIKNAGAAGSGNLLAKNQSIAKEKRAPDAELIALKLGNGISQYNQGNYRSCKQYMNDVLRLDKQNQRARQYLTQANSALVSITDIKAIIENQKKALEQKELPLLMIDYAAGETKKQRENELINFFQECEDVLFIVFPETIQIKLIDSETADVSFSNILSAVSKEEGKKKILFEGEINWTMKKQKNSWKIINYKKISL